MTELIINNQEIKLEVADDQIWTTSLQIADVFEKEHKHILAKIDELPQDDFRELNFRLTERTAKFGAVERSERYYKISRDGFTLLAMSFTGEKFYKFKVAYINAFNKMAEYIKSGGFKVPQNFAEALLLAAEQVKQIEALEAERIANLPKVVFAEAVEASATSALIGDFVKTLCDDSVSVGRNRVFKWLRSEKYLMEGNMPYQKWVDAGYFEVIPQVIVTLKGNKEKFTTRITAKGQVALSVKIIEAFKKVA